MNAHADRGGACVRASTVRRVVSRMLNRHAGALAEKVLAKALQGDSTAQLAAVKLLELGMAEPQNDPKA